MGITYISLFRGASMYNFYDVENISIVCATIEVFRVLGIYNFV